MGLCDIPVFPGSSGSPILIVNQGSYSVPNGITVGNRIIMLGILFGYFPLDIGEEGLLKKVPTTDGPIQAFQVPANLGLYVKSKELLVLKKIMIEKYLIK